MAVSEMLSGTDMLFGALHDQGMEYLLGYLGGAALHIYDVIFRQQNAAHLGTLRAGGRALRYVQTPHSLSWPSIYESKVAEFHSVKRQSYCVRY